MSVDQDTPFDTNNGLMQTTEEQNKQKSRKTLGMLTERHRNYVNRTMNSKLYNGSN